MAGPRPENPVSKQTRNRLRWAAAGLLLIGALIFTGVHFAEPLLCVQSHPRQADAIVVLGGEPVIRVALAAALVTNGFSSRVIVSGRGDCHDNQRLLEKMGIAANAIELECASSTTEENARFAVEQLRKRGHRRIIIVTSWFHSRRALSSFRHYAPEIEFLSKPVARTKSFYEERHYIGAEYLKTAWYFVRFGIVPTFSP